MYLYALYQIQVTTQILAEELYPCYCFLTHIVLLTWVPIEPDSLVYCICHGISCYECLYTQCQNTSYSLHANERIDLTLTIFQLFSSILHGHNDVYVGSQKTRYFFFFLFLVTRVYIHGTRVGFLGRILMKEL